MATTYQQQWLDLLASDGMIHHWLFKDWDYGYLGTTGANCAMRPMSQQGATSTESYMQRSITWSVDGWIWIDAFVVCAWSISGIRVYVDGVQQAMYWSDHGSARAIYLPITAGTHTIKISYYRGSSGSLWDGAWVRHVKCGVGNTRSSSDVFESWDFATATVGALPTGWTAGGSYGGWVIAAVPNPNGNSWNNHGYTKELVTGEWHPISGYDGTLHNQSVTWENLNTQGGTIPVGGASLWCDSWWDTPNSNSQNPICRVAPPTWIANFEWNEPFSVECYFNNNTYTSPINTLFMRKDPNGASGAGCGYGVHFPASGVLEWFMYANWSTSRQLKTCNLSLNTWYHLVVTSDGTGTDVGMKIYLNGAEVTYTGYDSSVGSMSGTTIKGTTGLAIGGRHQDDYPFDGQISHFAIFPSVLTPTQVMSHYAFQPNWSSISSGLLRVSPSGGHLSNKRPGLRIKNEQSHFSAKQKSINIRPTKVGAGGGRAGRISKLNPGED